MRQTRIVLAHPDREHLARMTSFLEDAGCEVLGAADALQALHALRRQAPDVVVAGFNLPGGGGTQFTEQMRQAGCEATPLVFVMDHDAPELQADAATLGAAAVLAPSDPPEALLDVVRQLTGGTAGARPRGAREALQVLVVEDDAAQCRLIRACLDAPGRESIDVTFAMSVAEARTLLQERKFNCVLLDHQLPDGEGLDVIEAHDVELLTTPVIGLFAVGDPDVAVQYFRAGVVDFFVKQEVLNADTLRRGITNAMARFQRRALATIIERQQIGSAISESQEGLIALARTDRLMGICNRGVFEEYLPAFHEEMAGANRPYAACMIDVDNFKSYNDRFGHAAGDDVLRNVARILAGALRSEDFLARYGGEELIVLLDGVGETEVGPLVERLCRLVAEIGLEHPDNQPYGRVTVSIGAAVCAPGSGTAPHEVVRQADAALFEAKRGGRNTARLARDADRHRRSA